MYLRLKRSFPGGIKAYRIGIRRQAAEFGPNLADIKVLFLVHPIVDVSMEAARDRLAKVPTDAEQHLDRHLSGMSRLIGIDFTGTADPDAGAMQEVMI